MAKRAQWTSEDRAIAERFSTAAVKEYIYADNGDAILMAFRTKSKKADRKGLEELGLL